jgi:hypothetical protein
MELHEDIIQCPSCRYPIKKDLKTLKDIEVLGFRFFSMVSSFVGNYRMNNYV